MSAPQFTPGPWELYDALLRPGFSANRILEIQDVTGAAVVAWSGFDGVSQSKRERKANAHLIAAAPELYEALEELVSFLRAHVEHFKSYNPLTEDALAALAKARGETL